MSNTQRVEKARRRFRAAVNEAYKEMHNVIGHQRAQDTIMSETILLLPDVTVMHVPEDDEPDIEFLGSELNNFMSELVN